MAAMTAPSMRRRLLPSLYVGMVAIGWVMSPVMLPPPLSAREAGRKRSVRTPHVPLPPSDAAVVPRQRPCQVVSSADRAPYEAER